VRGLAEVGHQIEGTAGGHQRGDLGAGVAPVIARRAPEAAAAR
jgi:hypothetical protein